MVLVLEFVEITVELEFGYAKISNRNSPRFGVFFFVWSIITYKFCKVCLGFYELCSFVSLAIYLV